MASMKRLLVVAAAVAAAAAAASGPDPEDESRPPAAAATIKACGRVIDAHYSFRVIAHGDRAPSCRTARQVARRAVGRQVDHPLPVPGWSCTADYFYDGPWSFLCIRRRTYGQVSIDRFRAVSRSAAASEMAARRACFPLQRSGAIRTLGGQKGCRLRRARESRKAG